MRSSTSAGPWPGRRALLLVSVALLGADGAPSVPFVRAPEGSLPADAPSWQRSALDVVATDDDLDGDTDLLVNWHREAPLELLENLGGRFERLSPPRSGLDANRGFPRLYATSEGVRARIEADGSDGLHVWYDPREGGVWRFSWRPESSGWRLPWLEPAGLRAEIEVTLGIDGIEGLAPGEMQRDAEERLRVVLSGARGPRAFALLSTVRGGGRLRVRVTSGSALRVGPELTPAADGEAELWIPDPHGIAWVDVEGGPRPELFVSRGAIVGKLLPPAPGKRSRYYLPDGPEKRYRLAPAEAIPPDYGRGRRVEWVDVDNDGVLEASIGNRARPDLLLARETASGAFVDRAGERGLGRKGRPVQAWLDWDGDGWQDLLVLRGRELVVLHNRSGERFEPVRRLAQASAGVGRELLDPTHIRLADFDADGQLDVFVIGAGKERSAHLLLRDGDGWREVGAELGISGLRGIAAFVLLDVDNDGFEDAVSFGREAWLWRNRGGRRFELVALPHELVPEPIFAAAALDADGDGRTDLFLAGKRRHLLLNASESGHGWIDVVPRDGETEPIGALVRAVHADGRIVVRRWGSAHNSRMSQALQPLRFGLPTDAPLVRLEVVWPGETRTQSFPSPPPGERSVLRRSPPPRRGELPRGAVKMGPMDPAGTREDPRRTPRPPTLRLPEENT